MYAFSLVSNYFPFLATSKNITYFMIDIILEIVETLFSENVSLITVSLHYVIGELSITAAKLVRLNCVESNYRIRSQILL